MFAISQSSQYGYAATAPAATPRQYSAHGTSSAFSSSANPDEDWTKISDLAERRRIQNRIAQRNYRKKLKRRLEDLERRAGSSDDAESEKPVQPVKTKRSPKKAQPTTPSKPVTQAQFTPPMEALDELVYNGNQYDERERSHTPPSLFHYSHYPPPDELILAPPYGSTAYPPMSSSESYSNYVTSSAVPTLPSLTHFSDAVKRDVYPSDEGLNQYMSYNYVSGVDYHGSSHYDQSHPHTPPLSHSYDHSANCSESGYEYPTTPLSMPGSPDMVVPQY